MVGTAYLAPQPGAPPFVKVGDSVREGQALLIIEAMKVMNQIHAPRARARRAKSWSPTARRSSSARC